MVTEVSAANVSAAANGGDHQAPSAGFSHRRFAEACESLEFWQRINCLSVDCAKVSGLSWHRRVSMRGKSRHALGTPSVNPQVTPLWPYSVRVYA